MNCSIIIFEFLEKNSLSILGASLTLLLGILISLWLKRLTIGFFKKIRLDQLIKRLGWEEAIDRIFGNFNLLNFFGDIVKWFFVLLFLMFAFKILEIPLFYQFLEKIVFYFPNIFISILIFIVALFLVDLSQKVFVVTLEKEKIAYSRFLGKEISFFVWLVAILAILYQLQIAKNLILIVFVGVVAIFVLTVGISFGLGGKDLAAKILKELEEKFK
jgi:hypothetical protein